MALQPKIIKGNHCRDIRGILTFNNDFNAFGIKRIYTLENNDIDFIRAWQGHQIEQRWFSAILGSFKIKLIEIDNWENPSKLLHALEFNLNAIDLDILHVPNGFISSIQALEKDSKLMVFADYHLSEVQDEYRFPADYFR